MAAGAEREAALESGEIFGSGDYRVGEDIQPGTYLSASDSALGGCYWERLDEAGEIIDNSVFRADSASKQPSRPLTIPSPSLGVVSGRSGDWVLWELADRAVWLSSNGSALVTLVPCVVAILCLREV